MLKPISNQNIVLTCNACLSYGKSNLPVRIVFIRSLCNIRKNVLQMKINYNEKEKSIEIKDDLKSNFLLMKFLIVLNLLNAILRLINLGETGFGSMEILWLIIGLGSLILLYFFLFKKSTSGKIKLDRIKKLREKSIFGRKRYSLELVNGKQRDLHNFKDEYEIAKLKGILKDLGIKIR